MIDWATRVLDDIADRETLLRDAIRSCSWITPRRYAATIAARNVSSSEIPSDVSFFG